MKKTLFVIVLIAAAALAGCGLFFYARYAGVGSASSSSGAANAPIRVVAAEDFYGSVAQEIGGDKVSVTSILSNPNLDPHEYESTVQDGAAVADADVVIENGLDYDTWMDKLTAASPNAARIVITAGDIAPDVLTDNPHVWYEIENIEAVASSTAHAFAEKDPADVAYFQNNLAAFDASLAPVQAEMNAIKSHYAGTPVGLTETIYLYETGPLGLDVLTPFDFEKAIAEGNDPSAASVASTDMQVADRQIKVLIYNSQTVTPVTTHLEDAAETNGIPVVPVTETMPSGDTYPQWILGELQALAQALASSTAAQ